MWVFLCVCVCSAPVVQRLCAAGQRQNTAGSNFPSLASSLPLSPSSPPAPSLPSHFLYFILWPLSVSLFLFFLPVLTLVRSSSHWTWSCSSCRSSRAESPAATYWVRSVFMVATSLNPPVKRCREKSVSCITQDTHTHFNFHTLRQAVRQPCTSCTHTYFYTSFSL